MVQPGNVTVHNASSSGGAFQLIGNNTIGSINLGATDEEKAQRQFESVLRWISPSLEAIELQSFIHGESRNNHKLEDTGHWFTDSTSFIDWLEGHSRLTWVNGGMGCGKTVLFFLAVERVRRMCSQDVSKEFGFFYCTSRGPSGQSIAVLFRSFLRQMCHHSKIPAAVQHLYQACDEGLDHREPSTRELARALLGSVRPSNISIPDPSQPKKYYLLIDGLDELTISSRDELLREFHSLFSPDLANVHVLIVSRTQRDIEQSLQEGADWISLPIDTELVQKDIRAYVKSEIQSHSALRRLSKLHDTILSRVADESNGMFRWAFLQMQSLKALSRPITQEKVEDLLQKLPKGLDETYDRMLNNLDDFDKPKARRALMWLIFSARQLYVEELVDACAFDIAKTPMMESKLAASDIELLLQDMVLIRPPLPVDQDIVEAGTYTVMLVHASIREYILRERRDPDSILTSHYFGLQERESNIMLAQSCLTYLLCFNTYTMRHSQDDYPLQRYSWYHWEDHIDVRGRHCVPTLPTALLRMKARRLYRFIKSHLDKVRGDDKPSAPLDSYHGPDGGDLSAVHAVLGGLVLTATLHGLDLSSLDTAINIPFFHPAYDEFCPSESGLRQSAPLRSAQSGNLEEESIASLKSRGRVASYYYRSLPGDGRPIRLLEILPAVDPQTMIRCRLTECEMAKAPPYAALSYVWGNPNVKMVIEIEGHTFHVSKSQHTLLQSMRSRTEGFNPSIWMDALCIDQTNNFERSGQVQIMGSIFAQAREVVVGLSQGDENASNDQCTHILADLAAAVSPLGQAADIAPMNLAKKKVLTLDQARGWESILEIFQNPWWRRVWVIQEIVLGFRAVILFGSLSFNFNLIEQIMLAEPFIKNVLRESQSPSLAAIEGNPGWFAAKQMVQTRLEYRHKGCFDLPLLLSRFEQNLANDPRDRVFALLALGDPDRISSLPISYELTVDDVSMQLSYWFLETYKTLDHLSILSAFPTACERRSSWPLPLLSRSENHLSRKSLNPGIFRGASSFEMYSAAYPATEALFSFDEETMVLSIKGGVRFDTVQNVLEEVLLNTGTNEQMITLCKEIGLVQSSIPALQSEQSTIEAKWRALLANQWPFGTKLETATLQGLNIPPQTASEEQALLDILEVPLDVPQLLGRRVIITSQGRLGLALQEVLSGDSIVTLSGGAVPYMLRPLESGNWKFVGECYVHNCMDGQVSKSFTEQGLHTETFRIV